MQIQHFVSLCLIVFNAQWLFLHTSVCISFRHSCSSGFVLVLGQHLHHILKHLSFGLFSFLLDLKGPTESCFSSAAFCSPCKNTGLAFSAGPTIMFYKSYLNILFPICLVVEKRFFLAHNKVIFSHIFPLPY